MADLICWRSRATTSGAVFMVAILHSCLVAQALFCPFTRKTGALWGPRVCATFGKAACPRLKLMLISPLMGTRADFPATRNFGPQNPETFFAAQKRNRRATWRMSALCAFAAFIMGIPLTLVLTPLLYVLTLAVAEVINHFYPIQDFLQSSSQLAQIGVRVADYVLNGRGAPPDPQELALTLALVLLPGMIVA